MSNLNRNVLSAILSLSVASVALAQGPATKPAAGVAPMPVHPPPQVDALFKPWEGNWKCDVAVRAGALGPGKPAATSNATIEIEREASGFWYSGAYEREGTKVVAPIRALFVLGYDSVARATISFRYDNWGTAVFETAPAATPEKQVFVGDAHMVGMNAKFRDTLMLKAPNDLEHTFEMDTGKGFQLMFTDACKR
jgi:hypothetical protein